MFIVYADNFKFYSHVMQIFLCIQLYCLWPFLPWATVLLLLHSTGKKSAPEKSFGNVINLASVTFNSQRSVSSWKMCETKAGDVMNLALVVWFAGSELASVKWLVKHARHSRRRHCTAETDCYWHLTLLQLFSDSGRSCSAFLKATETNAISPQCNIHHRNKTAQTYGFCTC